MDLSREEKHVFQLLQKILCVCCSCKTFNATHYNYEFLFFSKNFIYEVQLFFFFKLFSYRWDLLPLLVWIGDLVCSVLWH